MGFLKKAAGLFGLSGSGAAGRQASGDLAAIGGQIRNFTPIRVRSVLGTGTFDQGGVNLDADPRLVRGAAAALDFFDNQARQLAEFDKGGAFDRTLGLLRARRATLFDPQLSRLESRLLQQGRLGLGTGARAENPELASFFSAEAMADLEAQLAAANEVRQERSALLQSAAGGLGLAQEAASPSAFMQGLFNAEALRSARDIAAANVAAGGPALVFKGTEADRSTRASFFGNLASGAAGFFGGFSDRRLKRNIQKIGNLDGLTWYRFDYVWGEPAVGVMADEVRRVKPHAVRRVLGFDAVNYGAI